MKDAAIPGATAAGLRHRRRNSGPWKVAVVVVTSLLLLVGAAIPAAAAELMRVTFVRHGQSAGNASGLIDTSTPGPILTPTGYQQSQAVVGRLGDRNFDGIYASTMVRTQLTAAPMSQYLRLPIQVLDGLQEIEAGDFEGTPESEAANGYGLFPLAWAIQGQRDLRIPGSIDGNEFDARMDAALRQIWDNGDRNSVVFSHGGAIMFWTMMNAQNLTAAQKIDLLRTAPLSNTHYVVVAGSPEEGWTLLTWNGKLFSPEPTYFNELKRQVRTLTKQLGSSLAAVFESFASRNLATIATAINRAVVDASHSFSKFHRAMNAKFISDLERIFTPRPAVTPAAVTEESAEARVGAVEVAAVTQPAAEPTAAPSRRTDRASGLTVVPEPVAVDEAGPAATDDDLAAELEGSETLDVTEADTDTGGDAVTTSGSVVDSDADPKSEGARTTGRDSDSGSAGAERRREARNAA